MSLLAMTRARFFSNNAPKKLQPIVLILNSSSQAIEHELDLRVEVSDHWENRAVQGLVIQAVGESVQ
jgi:hypothetical protein